jgi:hypothetical protein
MKFKNVSDALNTVLRHQREYAKPSMLGNACAYNADNGSKCAVGCVLTEKSLYTLLSNNYNDGAGVLSVNLKFPEIIKEDLSIENLSDSDTLKFWDGLQKTHDDCALIYSLNYKSRKLHWGECFTQSLDVKDFARKYRIEIDTL